MMPPLEANHAAYRPTGLINRASQKDPMSISEVAAFLQKAMDHFDWLLDREGIQREIMDALESSVFYAQRLFGELDFPGTQRALLSYFNTATSAGVTY